MNNRSVSNTLTVYELRHLQSKAFIHTKP